MTVAELIAKLQDMPQDAEVLTYSDDTGFCQPDPTYCTAEVAAQMAPNAPGAPTEAVVLL